MGFWSKMKSRARTTRYVQVAFRSLDRIRDESLPNSQYTYSWDLPESPSSGVWVEVKGSDRKATAVVTAVGVTPERGLTIKPVLRCLTQQELDQAWAAALQQETDLETGLHIWLDMMRAKAGLPVEHDLPPKAPEGYPAIPPKSGKVIGQPAYDRGRVWMRAHHRAAENGREEDAKVFEDIAHAWYGRGRKRKVD